MNVILRKKLILTILWCLPLFIFLPRFTEAASLLVGPASGTFTVGSTFDVSVFLNTEGKNVNALEASLSFPADKLQIISPSTGNSIVGVWTAQPKFNNQTGHIDLQGGIPGGINMSNGIIATISFRVKSTGSAAFRFLDNSKVLLNDGKGTDALENTTSGIYQLILPPPGGPLVASETHPDQGSWYSIPNVILRWNADPNIEGYSYILNDDPVDVPDNIAEGIRNSIVYKNVQDGTHYFHIRASREGVWGGVTNFAVNIDSVPPAEFPIQVIPGFRTTRTQPIFQFTTTDSFSGLDHYEFELVRLNTQHIQGDTQKNDQPIFIEVESPYVPEPLEFGKYDIIMRAYDKAGNFREITERLRIVSAPFQFIREDGIEIGNAVIPWSWVWGFSGFLVVLLGAAAYKVRSWRERLMLQRGSKQLPRSVKKQLEELQRYRARYGAKVLIVLCVIASTFLMGGTHVFAQQIEFTPPIIATISRNISNEEIFYVGGKTNAPQVQVILYVQNVQTGETTSYNTVSDKRGDWFYRHDRFLTSGYYLLWAQSKIGEQSSPPTAQFQITVRSTALQFGSSRVSYESLYAGIIVVLGLLLLGLLLYILFHAYHGRKRHGIFVKEMREAEESIRRGFAVLRRDIEAELAVVKKAKLTASLSEEERAREEQLLKDFSDVEQHIGKEIWDVGETQR